MDGDESLSIFDEAKQRLFLIWCYLLVICIDHQTIVLVQVLTIQVLRIAGVSEINSFFGKGRGEDRHVNRRIVMFAVMPQKKYFNFPRACSNILGRLITADQAACQQHNYKV